MKTSKQFKTVICYMDTDSFIIHIKTGDFYKDIVDDVKKRYYVSDYEDDRPGTKKGTKNNLE